MNTLLLIAVGGLFGLVLGLLANLFLRLLRVDPKIRRSIASVAVAFTIIGMVRSNLIQDSVNTILGNKNRLEVTMAKRLEQMIEMPEFQERFKYVKTKEEMSQISMELARKGLVRLDDDQLLVRTRIYKELLDMASEQECAALELGTATSPQMFEMLNRLNQSSMDAWVDVSLAALRAELTETIEPAITEEQQSRALKALAAQLTQKERDRISPILEGRSTIIQEVCWGGRKLLETALALPDSYRRVWARMLVSTPSIKPAAASVPTMQKPKPVRFSAPPTTDADADGLSDVEEGAAGTDPQSADTDHDGLSDRDELRVYHTDPKNPDTDDDGYQDGQEVRSGYDPTVKDKRLFE
jgi:hypothetical protein